MVRHFRTSQNQTWKVWDRMFLLKTAPFKTTSQIARLVKQQTPFMGSKCVACVGFSQMVFIYLQLGHQAQPGLTHQAQIIRGPQRRIQTGNPTHTHSSPREAADSDKQLKMIPQGRLGDAVRRAFDSWFQFRS